MRFSNLPKIELRIIQYQQSVTSHQSQRIPKNRNRTQHCMIHALQAWKVTKRADCSTTEPIAPRRSLISIRESERLK